MSKLDVLKSAWLARLVSFGEVEGAVYGAFLAYDLLVGIFLAEAYLQRSAMHRAPGKSPGGYDPYEATALMFCVLTRLHS